MSYRVLIKNGEIVPLPRRILNKRILREYLIKVIPFCGFCAFLGYYMHSEGREFLLAISILLFTLGMTLFLASIVIRFLKKLTADDLDEMKTYCGNLPILMTAIDKHRAFNGSISLFELDRINRGLIGKRAMLRGAFKREGEANTVEELDFAIDYIDNLLMRKCGGTMFWDHTKFR